MWLEKNRLICGDNLLELPLLPAESIDLIYIDPPFFSNRNYEIIWGDEAEIRSFEDRWEGGINVYVDWMKQRVMELHRVLIPTGSLYLHCDWHAGHYLKVMLDEVFGMNRFQNDIIWFYKTGGVSKRRFGRKHDMIFFYTKSDKWTFNAEKIKSYQKHKYGFSNIKLEKDEKGIFREVYARDVWDIPALRGNQPETQHYETQKPEALLEIIIKSSSNEGDTILDAFCGCGTTLAVAQRLNRKWIGIDILPEAIYICYKRLKTLQQSDIIDILGLSEQLISKLGDKYVV